MEHKEQNFSYPHDLGGKNQDPEVWKEIDRSQHPYQYWEKQLDAIPSLLIQKRFLNLHSFRKDIESMDYGIYAKTSYYEKWAFTITKNLLEDGIIKQEELDRKLGSLDDEKIEKMYAAGDKVVVRNEDYSTRWRKPHLRTPGYIFGKHGVIERACGYYTNPETQAFKTLSTSCPLYRVRFLQKEIWSHYPGSPNDTIDIEITHHWLTLAESSNNPDVTSKQSHTPLSQRGHDDKVKTEQKAVNLEGEESPYAYLAKKLIELLIEKGIVSGTEITNQINKIDSIEAEPIGAVLVAKAWTDPEFKKALLDNPAKAGSSIGLNVPEILIAVENTDEIHNIVVCTLCSCYPKLVLGRPPDWYKSRSYRARTVYEPRKVLTEFGTHLPDNVTIRVHDSTADMRYLVVPSRPAGTEGWTFDDLKKIITRDSMIGVTLVQIQK
jgi:nitrile hydratase